MSKCLNQKQKENTSLIVSGKGNPIKGNSNSKNGVENKKRKEVKMFEVDVKGFAELQMQRPKWHFIRELISNSLDEMSVSEVSVTLKKDHGVCNIIVTDNGDGFARLSDAYTLFASTPKRSNSNVRGRFNMG